MSPAKAVPWPSFANGDGAASVGNTCVDTLYLRMLAYLAAICRSCKWSFDKRLSGNGIVPLPAATIKAADTVLMIHKNPDGFR